MMFIRTTLHFEKIIKHFKEEHAVEIAQASKFHTVMVECLDWIRCILNPILNESEFVFINVQDYSDEHLARIIKYSTDTVPEYIDHIIILKDISDKYLSELQLHKDRLKFQNLYNDLMQLQKRLDAILNVKICFKNIHLFKYCAEMMPPKYSMLCVVGSIRDNLRCIVGALDTNE